MQYNYYLQNVILERQRRDIYSEFIRQKQQQPVNKEDPNKVRLQSDIKEVKEKVLTFSSCIVPTLRKTIGVLNEAASQDTLKTVIHAVQVINDIPEDIRDVKSILKPIQGNVDYTFQTPFSFTRGTILSRFKIAKWIAKYDITLFDCKPVYKMLQKLARIKDYDVMVENNLVKYRAKGNHAQKIIARATMRIPVLAVGFSSACEIPDIVKAKDKKEQIKKSALKLGCIFSSYSLLGAFGGFYGGFASSTLHALGIMNGVYLFKKLCPILFPSGSDQ